MCYPAEHNTRASTDWFGNLSDTRKRKQSCGLHPSAPIATELERRDASVAGWVAPALLVHVRDGLIVYGLCWLWCHGGLLSVISFE